MNYEKFYTPPAISEILIKQIEMDTHPMAAIDICCGSCHLLRAAKKRWPDIQTIGVDVVDTQVADVIFTQSDGRKFAQNSIKKYNIVLANPPFEKLKSKNEYPCLGKGIIDCYTTSRLENEMFLANLQLLDDRGVLMAIMPSTFVEGTSNQALRKAVAETFHLQKIIRLPDSVFGSPKINSYAIVLAKQKKETPTRYYTIFDSEGKYKISEDSIIEQQYIKNGHWLKHAHTSPTSLTLDIKRGNISSQLFSEPENGIGILHTSRYSENWVASLRYVRKLPTSTIFAERGDIVVSRVGKAAGCWYEYRKDTIIAISDCLFRIKKPPASIRAAIVGQKYSGIIRGVSTPYITKDDIYNWFATCIKNS